MNPAKLLDHLRLAAPCPMSWNDMDGDDHVRVCHQCDRKVYNFTNVTPERALELIDMHEGRLCGYLYARADGTMIANNCPVGIRAVRRGLARGLMALAAVIAFGVTGFTALGLRRPQRLDRLRPFHTVIEWLDPAGSGATGSTATGRFQLAGAIHVSPATLQQIRSGTPKPFTPLTIEGQDQ